MKLAPKMEVVTHYLEDVCTVKPRLTDISLLRTVYFVPREKRKRLHLL